MMKLFKFTQFLGVLVVFFAAGSSDLGTIDFASTLQQVLFGLSMIGISKLLCTVTKPRQKYRLKENATVIPIDNLRKAV